MNGNPRAMYLLGSIEFSGEGRPRNTASSYAWLSMAKDKNIRGAADAYSQVIGELSPAEISAGRKLLAERTAARASAGTPAK